MAKKWLQTKQKQPLVSLPGRGGPPGARSRGGRILNPPGGGGLTQRLVATITGNPSRAQRDSELAASASQVRDPPTAAREELGRAFCELVYHANRGAATRTIAAAPPPRYLLQALCAQ